MHVLCQFCLHGHETKKNTNLEHQTDTCIVQNMHSKTQKTKNKKSKEKRCTWRSKVVSVCSASCVNAGPEISIEVDVIDRAKGGTRCVVRYGVLAKTNEIESRSRSCTIGNKFFKLDTQKTNSHSSKPFLSRLFKSLTNLVKMITAVNMQMKYME